MVISVTVTVNLNHTGCSAPSSARSVLNAAANGGAEIFHSGAIAQGDLGTEVPQ